jgi:hypothetical protein
MAMETVSTMSSRRRRVNRVPYHRPIEQQLRTVPGTVAFLFEIQLDLIFSFKKKLIVRILEFRYANFVTVILSFVAECRTFDRPSTLATLLKKSYSYL